MKINLLSVHLLAATCIATGCAATAVTVTDSPTPPALVIVPPGSNTVVVETAPVEPLK